MQESNDECCENIPPENSGFSQLEGKKQAENVHCFAQLGGGKLPHLQTCQISTPLPRHNKHGGREKSRVTVLLSPLTPILKPLNIEGELSSSKSPRFGVSFPPHSFTLENHQRSGLESWRFFEDAPMYQLENECLPEITLLDLTGNSTMQLTTNESVLPETAPATPKMCRGNLDQPTVVAECPDGKVKDASVKRSAPALSGALEMYLPEITLLDASHDSPAREVSTMNVRQEMCPEDYIKSNVASEIGGQNQAELCTREDLSFVSVKLRESFVKHSTEEPGEGTMNGTVETLQNSSSLPGTSAQMEKSQTSGEDALVAQPACITHDLGSSEDMSPTCTHLSSECNLSSNKTVSIILSEAVEVSGSEHVNSNSDAEATSKVPQQNPESAVSGNGTFTVPNHSDLTSSSVLNSSAPVQCVKNEILVPPATNSSPIPASEAVDEDRSVDAHPTSLADKKSVQPRVLNGTFDHYPPQKSILSLTSEEFTGMLRVQSNTFDSKQNSTVTLSEASSNRPHDALDKPPSPKVSNSSRSPKSASPECLEVPVNKSAVSELKWEKEQKLKGTFEIISAAEADSFGGMDLSQSGLCVTTGLSDTSSQQSVEWGIKKTGTFNLDESLDLRMESLPTSTPITICKVLNCHTQKEEGNILASQKKLYRDIVHKPNDTVPSNIVGDRKTFLPQPAAKSLRPPARFAPQLLRNKATSLLPRRQEAVATGLPVKRQKVQADTPKSVAASEDQHQAKAVSSSYSLRSLAAPKPVAKNSQGKKLALARVEALQVLKRKRMDMIAPPSQSVATGSVCESTSKSKLLNGPAGSQRSAPARASKNDVPLPPSSAKPTATRETFSRSRSPKPPGAAQKVQLAKLRSNAHRALEEELRKKSEEIQKLKEAYSVLEEELRIKSEEVQRLKEELLKSQKQEDCNN